MFIFLVCLYVYLFAGFLLAAMWTNRQTGEYKYDGRELFVMFVGLCFVWFVIVVLDLIDIAKGD